jgi:hypothetical protein
MSPNSFYVFQKISFLPVYAKYTQALLFASMLAGAILFYSLRGKKRLALFYAFIEFTFSLVYYWRHIESGEFEKFFIAVITSCVLPVTVYFFSEEIKTPENTIVPDGFKLIKEPKPRAKAEKKTVAEWVND